MDTMTIAYLSADEVNRDLAAHMGVACGASLRLLCSEEPLSDDRFDAVLYDLESLPLSHREGFIVKLLIAPSPCLVAVHGYNLDEKANTLRDKGIVVSRRLEPQLFRDLCRSFRPVSTTPLVLEAPGRTTDSTLFGEITISMLGVELHDR